MKSINIKRKNIFFFYSGNLIAYMKMSTNSVRCNVVNASLMRIIYKSCADSRFLVLKYFDMVLQHKIKLMITLSNRFVPLCA